MTKAWQASNKEKLIIEDNFLWIGVQNMIIVKENQQAFPLNYLFGVYREEKGDLAWEWIHPFSNIITRRSKDKEPFKWQIFFVLNPLNASLNKIQQALVLKDETSYFDGIHGYLLAPIVEK